MLGFLMVSGFQYRLALFGCLSLVSLLRSMDHCHSLYIGDFLLELWIGEFAGVWCWGFSWLVVPNIACRFAMALRVEPDRRALSVSAQRRVLWLPYISMSLLP